MFIDRVGQLSRSSGRPLYEELEVMLRRAIEDEVLAPDEALPPERDLAQAFNISRVTVRRALDGLVEARLLRRRHGAGTFVAPRIEKDAAVISSFSEDMAARGLHPRSEWIDRTIGLVAPDESLALALSPGSQVHRLSRIRYADERSMAIELAVVPTWALPDPMAVDESLYRALGRHRPTRVLQRLRAVSFDGAQAALLAVADGSPALEIERRGFAADGRAVEFTRSWYRGDAYDFVTELTVAGAP